MISSAVVPTLSRAVTDLAELRIDLEGGTVNHLKLTRLVDIMADLVNAALVDAMDRR